MEKDDEQKHGSRASGDKAVPAAAGSTTSSVRDAYIESAKAWNRAGIRFNREYVTLFRMYYAALNNAQGDATRRSVEAGERLAAVLADSWSRDDTMEHQRVGYADYASEQEDIQLEFLERVHDAYWSLLRDLEEMSGKANVEAGGIYRHYVDTCRSRLAGS